jgi:1,4-dihydroxy-2-naphthoyl-CoA synthase
MNLTDDGMVGQQVIFAGGQHPCLTWPKRLKKVENAFLEKHKAKFWKNGFYT